MPKRTGIAVAVVLVLLLVGIGQSFYTVDETQRGVILQLGKPVGETVGPGLHFKLPFVQNVLLFDHRIQDYDANPAEILTEDKKNLVVDNYSRWRIEDPLKFYRTVRTVSQGVSRIDDIVYSELRVELGQYTLNEVVSSKRGDIMTAVRDKADALLDEYGIKIFDVRIKRTDLPEENQMAIFGRMRSEREREAKRYRSEGHEEASKIRAVADKDRTIMLAEAERKAQILRGEGDAEAARIFAEALGQDKEFFSFVRSLEAYEKGLSNSTRLIMDNQNEFLRYLQ
ncbi:protease modulator HflC [Desulfohalobium retbaense]|uniref:Protein HflC n=1 Tax=Desulfohalobium retbaense (strain ATCC 49708 / DSM 5692 / JCM 16813 / HR100) TaxID=485915 RepID=C8X0F9_DESRD|nr:protease modulator HflC [Desulfohalobium retbaense]ACV67784.1 HflC protein [Desulfohalobium retbaense DSM 5692]